MRILSITFHAEENVLEIWENFCKNELQILTENLMDVQKYMISEVESAHVSEGKNTNLLLFFENSEKRKEFETNEFLNIQERISMKFSDKVVIFKTCLNPFIMKI